MNRINGQSECFEPSGMAFDRVAYDLIKNMPMGVIAFDGKLNISDINTHGQNIFHCNGQESIDEILAQGSNITDRKSWHKKITAALVGMESVTFENTKFKNGDFELVLRIICIPMTTEGDSKNYGGVLLVENITEIIMMQQELASAERLASVGKLAAKVAHELNNPLDGILRYLNLSIRVLEQSGQDQPIKYLEECRKGLGRMVKIVSELLNFSRSSYQALEQTDINIIITDAINAIQLQADDKQIEIVKNLAKNMPLIRSGNLFQVFTNLIKNAIDATRIGGTINITSKIDNKYLLIDFADTGLGIDDDIIEKLFEPFFSTKENGKGTGLGLPICKDIVQRYNGTIIPGNRTDRNGAIFTVKIPLGNTNWIE